MSDALIVIVLFGGICAVFFMLGRYYEQWQQWKRYLKDLRP